MKNILKGLFLLITVASFSQSISDLEYELSFYKSGEEWGNKKNIAFKLLRIDSLNASAINYLVAVYGRNNQKDSINFLFDRLIKEHPNSPEPLLMRTQERNAGFAGLTYNLQINYLKEAHKLDSINQKTIARLGNLYYGLFIKEFTTEKNKANLDYYSLNATKYFSSLYNTNLRFKESLKFPLLQLANYDRNLKNIQLYESCKIQYSFFPISAYADLPFGWQTNYSVNVIDFVSDTEFKVAGVESALFKINWYASQLNALDEPILNDSLPTKVFRFTWLRTFHNPIVIGLENKNDLITLYWKVCDGAGGYEPGKIIQNKSKILTIKEWNDFVESVISINFWNLSTTQNGILGTDGAQWILEGKEVGKYHVVDRWSGGTIKSLCIKLLDLTDLKINKEEIY